MIRSSSSTEASRAVTLGEIDAVLNCFDPYDDGNDAAALLRRIAASMRDAAGPEPWADIATAPKDGTRVLAWWPYWSTYPAVAWVDQFGRWVSDVAVSDQLETAPTHWMPLPDPPKAEGR